MECPICKNKNTSKSNIISRDNSSIEIWKCRNCFHWFQSPSTYQEIYISGEFTSIARNNEPIPSIDKIKSLDNKAFLRYKYFKGFIDKNNHFLEIGSSIGSFVHVLKLLGKEAEGLEPDPSYADFSEKQYGFSQYNTLLEDLNSSKKYQFICSFHVIEHVKSPMEFVEKAHHLLENNGKLLLEMPSLELHSYGSMKQTMWKPHIHYFTISSLYYLISRHFKIIEIGYYGIALYVLAEKSSRITFNKWKFFKLKLRKDINYIITHYFPSLPLKLSNLSGKQLLLQSTIYHKNKINQLSKLLQFSKFAIKNKFYLYKEKKNNKPVKATHISYYSGWENAGDTVLSKCVRDLFNLQFNIGWELQKITDHVTENKLQQIEASRFLVLGGGGVLLPDSNANNISGWQWAISKSDLQSIKVPMLIFGIGYNYFAGQKPSGLFIENLNVLIQKSDFFGLRNRGSINKINKLTQNKFKNKVRFQPCPTTIIRMLNPNLPQKVKSKNIGVNLAYDRYEKRFGKNIYLIINQIAKALKVLSEKGYSIYNICHLESDRKFELTLNYHQISYKTVNLQYALPEKVYKFYNNMELVMGMRGHAQMIPFGLNCKILSLGSHDKLKWFLEDIEAIDWWIDLRNDTNHISEIILSKSFDIIKKSDQINEYIKFKQNNLYNITMENMKFINSIIGKD